jgi:hypothetical protein
VRQWAVIKIATILCRTKWAMTNLGPGKIRETEACLVTELIGKTKWDVANLATIFRGTKWAVINSVTIDREMKLAVKQSTLVRQT